jgi:hypothetical protein
VKWLFVMRIIRIFLLPAFIFLCHACLAQQYPVMLDSASGQLIRNIRLKQTEQLFIVTDKSLYRTGENIWFRIFLLKSASQKMSGISKNIFVDLINNNDSVLSTLLLDAGKAQLGAKLNLVQSAGTGFYWIRAYTKYMTRQEKDKIPLQPIYVINPASPNEGNSRVIHKNNSQPGISLQFFPEGGSVITGANSTIAFHIVDSNKEPVAVSGYVKDNHDSIITAFASDKYGLGKFEFFPTRGRTYKAYLGPEEKNMVYPLPPYNFYAGQLSATKQINGDIKLRVLLEDSIYQKNFRTCLVGVAKDSLCFASIGTGMYEVTVPEKKLPAGTTTFYLLDEKLNLLSERSIYIRNNLTVKAELDKTIYQKRDKADLTVSIADAQNRPVLSSLCIAVTDSNFVQPANIHDIVSVYFENRSQPLSHDWWLANAGDLSDQQLDILMMAAADSHHIMNKEYNPGFLSSDDDSLLYITGRAVYQDEKPAAKKIATLFSPSGNSAYATDTITNAGRFVFPLTAYPDSTRVSIQVINQRGNNEEVNIFLDTLKFPDLSGLLPKKKFSIKPAMINDYLKFYPNAISIDRSNELGGVTVTGYKRKESKYDESKRISQNSWIITHDDLGRGGAGRITNAILRVPGLQVIGGFIAIKGLSGFGSGPSTEPIIVVDGVQVFTLGGDGMGTVSPVLSYLNSLNADEISFIEVLTGPEASSFGVRGRNGVILINTGATEQEQKSNNSLHTFLLRGYHTPPSFLMPDYNNTKTKMARFNDLRSTLYWQAANTTDPGGKTKITFFTSDVITTYKIIITGVTVNGDIIYKTLGFRTQ